ncbi:hypothetical protein WQ54_09885 [Bacillus sp. SA1-12]|nr:hypothetical protein WQ54_09885 [Bacillus sp. SA1-12]
MISFFAVLSKDQAYAFYFFTLDKFASALVSPGQIRSQELKVSFTYKKDHGKVDVEVPIPYNKNIFVSRILKKA